MKIKIFYCILSYLRARTHGTLKRAISIQFSALRFENHSGRAGASIKKAAHTECFLSIAKKMYRTYARLSIILIGTFFLSVTASDFDASLSSLHYQLEGLSLAFTQFPGIELSSKMPGNKGITYILNNTVIPGAPTGESLEQFARATGIRVIQLVVAWQDLTVEDFIKGPGTLIETIRSVPQNNNLYENLKKHGNDWADTANVSIGGGYASCGYHTVLHLDTVAQYFLERVLLSNLTSLAKVNELFGVNDICKKPLFNPCGTWRTILIEAQKKRPPGDAKLCDDEGEWISHEAMLMLTHKTKHQKAGIVYSKAEVAGQIEPSTEKSIGEAVESAIKTAKDPRAQDHLFFWINNGAHWYGICIVVSQKLCIIVDSKNSPRYDDKSTKSILHVVFKEQTARINSAWTYLHSQPIIIHGFDSEKISLDRVLALSAIENEIDPEKVTENLHSNNVGTLTDNDLAFIFENFAYFASLKNGTLGEEKLTLAQFIDTYKKVMAGEEVLNVSDRFKVFVT